MRLFARSNESINFRKEIKKLLGFKPRNLSLYAKAFVDPALRPEGDALGIETNDRLEFLGDSILGMHVSKYLYTHKPSSPVGTLSALKAHIVSRQVSNSIARELGLERFLPHQTRVSYSKDVLGNALEALIASIYLDRGIAYAERFITQKIIPRYLEMKLESADFGRNFKGELQLWADKQSRKVEYVTENVRKGKQSGFVSKVIINEKKWGEGIGQTKKSAEQNAAREVLNRIGKRILS